MRNPFLLSVGVLYALFGGWFARAYAQENTESLFIMWEPNREADLAGYRVYWGTSSRSYRWVVDVGKATEYEVTGLEAGTRYYFAVTAYDLAGNESDFSAEVSAVPGQPNSATPSVFVIFQNYPNPFNPSTVIPFYLPERGLVELVVLNSSGQLVRRLIADELGPGYHEVSWDGLDDAGQPVASGVYFVHGKTAGFRLARPVVLMR
jgi:hypothetical protein